MISQKIKLGIGNDFYFLFEMLVISGKFFSVTQFFE